MSFPGYSQKQIKKHAVFLSVLFLFCIAIGYIAAKENPAKAEVLLRSLAADVQGMEQMSKTSIFIFIFGGNTAKSFLAMIFGIFFGIFPVVFVALHGIFFGLIGTAIAGMEGTKILLLGTIPHGIFEIPGLILSCAYGMLLGGALWRKIRKKEAMRPKFRIAFQKFGTLAIPLFAVASFIETFITAALLDR